MRGRSDSALLASGCAFALAGVMLHAIVDFPLQIASLQLFTILLAGLSWGLGSRTESLLRSS